MSRVTNHRRHARWLLVLPTLVAPAPAQPMASHDETLANGLRVVVVERPALPLVTLALYLRGGMLLDRPATFRHGRLAMGCLWMGHGDRDEEAVRVALGDIGAEFDSFVDLQDTRVHLSCLAEHGLRGLELLAGATLQPTFADDIVTREREQERRLLHRRSRQPEYLAQESFVRAVVGPHPLADGYSLHDRLDVLAHADRDAVRAAWERMMQPQLGTLFLVGRVTPELVRAAKQRFGAWPAPQTPTDLAVPRPLQPTDTPRVIKVPLPEMTQVYLQCGMLGPAPDAAIAPAADVMRLAMAGGFTSSLEDELRVNRGLVYDISFSRPTLTFDPPYSLATQTRADKVGEVLDEIARLLRAAAQGHLRPAQIEAARNMWLGTSALERESQLGRADAMHRSLRVFGDFDGAGRQAAAVRATTGAQVAKAAALFDPAKFVIVMVGAPSDLEKIDWKLAK